MENTCRLCLTESSKVVKELWYGSDILNKLSKSLSYFITQTNNLPNKICDTCANKVEEVYIFHQTIHHNEIVLQKKYGNMCNIILDTEIKVENNCCDENKSDISEPVNKDNLLNRIDIKSELQCKAEKTDILKKKNLHNDIEEYNYSTKENVSENTNLLIEEVQKFDEARKYTCLTCFKVFPDQLKLLRHYKNVELEKYNERNKLNNYKADPIKYHIDRSDDNVLYYKCGRCNKKYRHKTYIKRHVLSHIEIRPFLCNLCGKTYQTASAIVAHGKMHTDQMYVCSYKCGYKSVHKRVVKDHEKRHTKEYKYTCKICSKGFQVKTWYEQHYNIHNNVKPFSCDVCGKKFHLQKYLNTHKSNVHPQSSDRKPWLCKLCYLPCDSKNTLNLHLKENHKIAIKKSILCDVCGKVVRDAQELRHHKWSLHSLIKPYVCRFCNKSFSKKCTLKVHEQAHTGKQHSCDTCDKMFSRKSTLRRHIIRFHLESEHKCEECNKTFQSGTVFDNHHEHCLKNADNPAVSEENILYIKNNLM